MKKIAVTFLSIITALICISITEQANASKNYPTIPKTLRGTWIRKNDKMHISKYIFKEYGNGGPSLTINAKKNFPGTHVSQLVSLNYSKVNSQKKFAKYWFIELNQTCVDTILKRSSTKHGIRRIAVLAPGMGGHKTKILIFENYNDLKKQSVYNTKKNKIYY